MSGHSERILDESPLDAAFARLRQWSGEITIGWFEKPTYKNQGELKADVRLVLDELAAARVDAISLGNAWIEAQVADGDDPADAEECVREILPPSRWFSLARSK